MFAGQFEGVPESGLGFGCCVELIQQALHGSDERWQVHLDRRLDDRVGRVEVPVGDVVPHPGQKTTEAPWSTFKCPT